jgi:hypothetical protein
MWMEAQGMTDFLTWWADHWPLVPILLLYPIYAVYVMGLKLRIRRRGD